MTARVTLLGVAQKHKIEKADTMDDKAIKVAVIKSVRGDRFSVDGKSDDYIDAAFDMAKADEASHEDGMSQQRQEIKKPADNQSHSDSIPDDDPQAALDKLQQDEADLWMKEVR